MSRTQEIKARIAAHLKVSPSNLKESFLREEKVLKNNVFNYTFNFEAAQGGKQTERKIQQSDMFVCYGLGMFLLREDSTKIGTGVLRTHVNSTDFAATTGFTPAHLENIYNSLIRTSVNNEVQHEAIDTSVFRKVPTEFTPTDGRTELEPALVWQGGKKNIVELICPPITGIEWESVTNNFDNKVVLYAYGFQLFNAR